MKTTSVLLLVLFLSQASHAAISYSSNHINCATNATVFTVTLTGADAASLLSQNKTLMAQFKQGAIIENLGVGTYYYFRTSTDNCYQYVNGQQVSYWCQYNLNRGLIRVPFSQVVGPEQECPMPDGGNGGDNGGGGAGGG